MTGKRSHPIPSATMEPSASATPPPPPAKMQCTGTHEYTRPLSLHEEIQLTAAEEKLFEFLLDVEKQYGCKAVLRVAGGWVRDKLLGRNSDDIDIVLDTMTGKEFADLINAYETDHGHKQHPVGIIKANPDQSKHLETATMQLGDGWVDFVNLRAETYSEDHRIPEVEFGTPVQDAERRDFTINSLFYNISEKTIEDFTQRGVEDLRNGIVRTPLDPRVTFLDDPLRVLRAVRFASRFNFELHDEIREAVDLPEVKEALVKKVSRERVGKELLGMLTGSSAHPERALKTMHELRLCRAVFLPPLSQDIYNADGSVSDYNTLSADATWDKGYVYAARMYELLRSQAASGIVDVSKMTEAEQNDLKLRVFAAFLLPLASNYVLVKKREVALPTFIIRETLKLRNRDAEDVGNIILKYYAELENATKTTFDRVNVGLLLRNVGALWPLGRDLAMVKELTHAESPDLATAIVARYESFSNAVITENLDGIWDMRPLLNGNDIIKVLGVKPGPDVKATMEKVVQWQLGNPSRTREECLEHFRQMV
ncbi:TPA: hypothetical protein N0F65_001488 [Lagenidium giganteum]|uniref:Poly A polymerase head domain-containing protein n=1 Tax=Lagenidium giganteum TaxID=4803 RepID=A0AAV2Z040_9STRA|nr:TPA: hypothetical protein N0F65_001488 [Lagenidium giganteum]